MVKFILTGADGHKLIGIAITRENVERLKDDQPIRASLADWFAGDAVPDLSTSEVVVMYGDTEADIIEQFGPMLAQAKLNLHPDDATEFIRRATVHREAD